MKIVVLAGGISTERDVSLTSGSKIYEALKGRGHEVIFLDIFLGYEGNAETAFSEDKDWTEMVAGITEREPDINKVKAMRKDKSNVLFGPNVIKLCQEADIVFMGLHGDSGENGKVQAAFDLLDIKYTGTDYLSSALAMDKGITKQMFLTYGVSTPKSYLMKDSKDEYIPDLPCVVKICNGGSSVGVFIAHNKEEYEAAIEKAFEYEGRVLIEQYIKGREFTDCVIEGEALPIVEIIPKTGFYDYKNKYQAGSTEEICPAAISEDLTKRIQSEAIKAYDALGIKTYARMDFIVDDDNNIYCLEANTLPGMTPTSLIPQEAAAIGKSFPELCEWIIEVSLKKYQ